MDDAPRPAHLPKPADRRAEISLAYDQWAGRYDADENLTRDLDARVLRRTGLDVDGRDVLELGCGTAKNTMWLAERARHVVGMDFSPGMLGVARSRVASDNVEFLEHDVQSTWPIKDACFDFVIGNLVLEHVHELAPVFAEARRVLRPDGTLFVCELHPYRQLRGGQAHFTGPSGETVYVSAYVHSASDYVNAGIGAGLALRRMDEWRDEPRADRADRDVPRLISLRLVKPGSGR